MKCPGSRIGLGNRLKICGSYDHEGSNPSLGIKPHRGSIPLPGIINFILPLDFGLSL